MLIMRKVFSSSFASSADSGEDTSTTRSMNSWYTRPPSSVHRAVTPPNTFGVFFVNHFGFPGSTRSGEKQRKKSLPTDSPFDSKRGSISSRVVPGYVVDSSTTICPGRSRSTIASVAATMYDMSGSFVFPSGVGTHTEMTSHSPRRDMSVVASSLPRAPQRCDVGALHVLDVALTGVYQRRNPLRDLEADDLEPRAPHFDGQRQPHVAESHHAAHQFAAVDFARQRFESSHRPLIGW